LDRAAPDAYLDRYSPEQALPARGLAGITGWAQVNGATNHPGGQVRLDVWYVDHWSFLLDMKILLLTLWKVIRREASASQASDCGRVYGFDCIT
jgi:lipopolysaccharide/colanic/teichoic acid biosynthesis glycosyltransferase